VGDAGGDLADHRQARHEYQPLPQLLLLRLCLALGREITDEAEKLGGVSVRQHADRKKDGEAGTPLALRNDLAAAPDDVRCAALQVASDVLIVLGLLGVGHQDADVAAEHLGSAVAEKPLGTGIEGLDQAPMIDEHYSIHCGIEHCLQRVFADGRFASHWSPIVE